MHRTRSAFSRSATATVSLLACLAVGCSTSAPTTRIVCGTCEEPDRFVRLQTHVPSGRTATSHPFAHPLSLSREEWGAILDSIKIQTTTSIFLFFTKREPDQPAFGPADNAALSGMLSKAFTQAQPHEVVVFGVTEREGAGLMKMTTGGWFAREGQLHLVLGNYRFAVTMESIRERLIADPLRPTTGRTFEMTAGAHQRVIQDGRLISQTLGPDPVELALDYRPLLAGDSSATRLPSAAPPDSRPIGTASLEERLDRLKRLRDSGRITEEEYLQKRKELLGQL